MEPSSGLRVCDASPRRIQRCMLALNLQDLLLCMRLNKAQLGAYVLSTPSLAAYLTAAYSACAEASTDMTRLVACQGFKCLEAAVKQLCFHPRALWLLSRDRDFAPRSWCQTKTGTSFELCGGILSRSNASALWACFNTPSPPLLLLLLLWAGHFWRGMLAERPSTPPSLFFFFFCGLRPPLRLYT